ncbi:rhodanese-like domain-containing protein [Natronobacterium gregoryi]|uniref:Rhodanese-like domain-containing protein n=2 Tax=Natronobacterium gregoryi TaxID=44930 RepID=L0AIS7_NATGS|nr:rhodanese-like domain-containing protein [Natronobacterium gregoryi]AFZ73349.1 Rhodanese-related sulfurtransferase [Natronobacterium gregoryi SP2]PLK18783.1 rhodanese-like domain-containing protein [Natronobacterium gregoryi SP2]SFJ63823.1 Rhodanese-related sulfurtransferase [Natronobacterium gregoryi]
MVEEISPDAVKEKLENGDGVQIVDIRPEREYERGHIPGAVNVPMNELSTAIDQYEWGDDVVVACPIGQSSIQAARLIGSYEDVDADAVASMEGGYQEWEYDLEAGSSSETDDEAESEAES